MFEKEESEVEMERILDIRLHKRRPHSLFLSSFF
jgi:hypothetical protein